jgi:hypothetical protein
MKALLYLCLIVFLFTSCEKEKEPEIENFYSVKASLLAWNECTAITDLVLQKCDNYTTWLQNGMSIENQLDSSFTMSFNNSTMDDKHKRSGSISVNYFGSLTKDTNKIILDFVNFKTNEIQVSGQLVLQENSATFGSPYPGINAYSISGTLNFSYLNGNTASASYTLNYQYQYDYGSFVNGVVNGTNQLGQVYTSASSTNLKRGSLYQNISNSYPVFYNGKYELTEGSKSGFVWYGYKDECDNYGFTEWADSKFNFFLEDY